MRRIQTWYFIDLTPKTIKFFQSLFELKQNIVEIIQVLTFYLRLDEFMRISKDEDDDLHEKQILEFKSNLIECQEAASETICKNKKIETANIFMTTLFSVTIQFWLIESRRSMNLELESLIFRCLSVKIKREKMVLDGVAMIKIMFAHKSLDKCLLNFGFTNVNH